jgi:phosphoglycolate phosphatase
MEAALHRQSYEIRDAEAAREAGMAFGAVAWGFTSADALRAQDPTFLFRRMDEIADSLIAARGAATR